MITLDYADRRPIYEQVVDKMKELKAINASKQTQLKNAITAADEAIRLYGIESNEALSAINALNNQSLSGDAKTAMADDVTYLLKIRTNSHDSAKEDRALEVSNNVSANSTLAIESTNVANDEDSLFVYTAATNTLYVRMKASTNRFWPSVTGELEAPVTVVVADGVDTLEFKNVTMTAESTSLLETTGLEIELTGTNVINGSLGTVSKYFGTGSLYNGSTLVRMQGDVTDDDDVTTADVRELLMANVKATTLTDAQNDLSDANGDGKVNTVDTRMFLKVALENA